MRITRGAFLFSESSHSSTPHCLACSFVVRCWNITCQACILHPSKIPFHSRPAAGEWVPTIGIVAAEGGRAKAPLLSGPPAVGSAFFPPISPEHHLSPEGKPKGGGGARGGAVETDERAGGTRAASLLSSLGGLCVNREVDHITFEVCVMYAAATAIPFLVRVFSRFIEW